MEGKKAHWKRQWKIHNQVEIQRNTENGAGKKGKGTDERKVLRTREQTTIKAPSSIPQNISQRTSLTPTRTNSQKRTEETKMASDPKKQKLLPPILKKPPRFQYYGDRDYSSPAAKKARLQLDTHTRSFYNIFWDTYQNLRIQPPFRTTLTQEQQALCTVVTNLSEWDVIAHEFQLEVETHQFLSFDIEELDVISAFDPGPSCHKTPNAVRRKVVYALFSTLLGKTVIFDLEEMFGGPVPVANPLEPVPPEFTTWIKSKEIIIAGSAIHKDIATLGLEGRSLCDTGRVFEGAMMSPNGNSPLIELSSNTRTGLGIQAFYSKGIDYKPMGQKDFIVNYGAHRYYDEKGNRRWPAWRDPRVLYRWIKREGKLRDFHLFYMMHDSTTPAALMAKLFLDFCHKGGKVSCKTVAEYLHESLGPMLGSTVPEEVLELAAPELERELNDTVNISTDSSEKQVSPEKEKGKVQPPLLIYPHTQKEHHEVLPANKEDGEVSDEEVQVLPVEQDKVVRTGKPRAGTIFAYWDWSNERSNPYFTRPHFARLCIYCGVGKHSYKSKTGDILCDKAMEDPEGEKCTYNRCPNKSTHRTPVCPALHQKCNLCGHRGHSENDGCPNWTRGEWRAALDDFENAADEGVYTKSRRRDERWGFWAHKWNDPFPYFAPYPLLLRMDIEDVDMRLGLGAAYPGPSRPWSKPRRGGAATLRRGFKPRPPRGGRGGRGGRGWGRKRSYE